MALRRSLSGVATSLVAIVRTRIELFALEATDQKSQLVSLLAWVAGAVVFMLLGLIVLTVTLALLFWPTEGRYIALFLMALFYLLAGLVCIAGLRRSMVQADSPFSATLQELQKDLLILEKLRDGGDSTSSHRQPPSAG